MNLLYEHDTLTIEIDYSLLASHNEWNNKGETRMDILQWEKQADLKSLLLELVSWESLTGTEGEKQFSHKLKNKLLTLDYFKSNPEKVRLHGAGEGRFALTALYLTEATKKTIVLISHHDTVHVEEYGDLKEFAFTPGKLTDIFKEQKNIFSKEVQEDITSGNYLFGRGVMDMKMGLALHLQLLEKAIHQNWPINLILVTVPDEEVNSAGMRTAVPALTLLQEQFKLDITLFLNSEPSFSQYPGDEQYYIYTGSIGKIMPSALFCGKETHAGEPLGGMTGQFIASFLTRKMEWNNDFTETAFDETTPLPVTLSQFDLKDQYSTQTTSRTAALYNVFMMNYNAEEVMNIFRKTAEEAAAECNQVYHEVIEREKAVSIGEVNVLDYRELLTYANKKITKEKVNQLIEAVLKREDYYEREKSIRIVDTLMLQCQELAPAMVLFFAPPYYPAVNSSNNAIIREKVRLIQHVAKEDFAVNVQQIHYFNGISDLSYVNYDKHDNGWQNYVDNTPVWGEAYTIPFAAMQQLQAPVLNVGPFGKDAHKVTERLHEDSAFVQTPKLLEELIHSYF